MSLTIKLSDLSVPQGWILQDATPFNDGVMTAAQAAKLAGLVPGGGLPDQAGNAGKFLETDGTNTSWQALPNPEVLPFTDNALTHTLSLGKSVLESGWLQITPGDPGAYTIFNGTCSSFPNVSGPNDDVVNLGWNLNGGGAASDPTKGAIGISFESRFLAAHDQQEMHLLAVNAFDSLQTRFVSMENHNDDGTTAIFIAATNGRLISGRTAADFAPLQWGPTGATCASGDDSHGWLVDNSNTYLFAGTGNFLSQVFIIPGEFSVQLGAAGSSGREYIHAVNNQVTLRSQLVLETGGWSFADVACIVMNGGENSALSGAGQGVFRYNAGTNHFEMSVNGGAFVQVGP